MKPNCTSFFYLLEVTQYSRSLCLPHFKPLAFFFRSVKRPFSLPTLPLLVSSTKSYNNILCNFLLELRWFSFGTEAIKIQDGLPAKSCDFEEVRMKPFNCTTRGFWVMLVLRPRLQ